MQPSLSGFAIIFTKNMRLLPKGHLLFMILLTLIVKGTPKPVNDKDVHKINATKLMLILNYFYKKIVASTKMTLAFYDFINIYRERHTKTCKRQRCS
jgi:hypothetical protein